MSAFVVISPGVNPNEHLPVAVGLPLLVAMLVLFGWTFWRLFKS